MGLNHPCSQDGSGGTLPTLLVQIILGHRHLKGFLLISTLEVQVPQKGARKAHWCGFSGIKGLPCMS